MKDKKQPKLSNEALTKKLEEAEYRAHLYARVIKELMVGANLEIVNITEEAMNKWNGTNLTVKTRANPELNCMQLMVEIVEKEQ